MYNILVVDDEKVHRKGLVSLLEEICSQDMMWEAADGREALEFLEKMPCDIIVSDIRMSDMDGIALLKEIKRHRPEVIFIIISGYAEFSYAREALAFGASAYLLKPAESEELKEAIFTAKRKLSEQREEDERNADMHKQLEETASSYMERLLNYLVQNREFPEKAQLHSLLPLEQDGYLLLVKATMSGKSGTFSEHRKRELGYMLKKAFDPQSSITFEVYHMDNTLATFILGKELPKDKDLHSIQTLIERKGYVKVYLALSNIKVNLYNEAIDAFAEAEEAMSFAFYEERSILHYIAVPHKAAKEGDIPKEEKLAVLIQQEKAMEAAHLYTKTLQEIRDKGIIRPTILKCKIAFLFYHTLRNIQPLLSKELVGRLSEEVNLLVEAKDYTELLTKGKLLLFRMGTEVQRMHKKDNSTPVQKIKEYIDHHYMDEINMEVVAGMFHFNSSYFSTLFKSSFGKSFSEYLSEVRMAKAIRLLLHSEYKVKDIAKQVGYRDSNYFIRAFRKTYDITPDEFRKKGNV